MRAGERAGGDRAPVAEATASPRCPRHGEATRLSCVDCEQPICPRCLTRTPVGLKCEACAAPAAPSPAASPVTARPRSASRRPLLLAGAGLAGIVVAVVLATVVAGGDGGGRTGGDGAAEAGTWTALPALDAIRGTPVAVVLGDGSVLVAGGGVGAVPVDASRRFDPATGRWTETGPLVQARRGHAAAVLPDGRVLVAGGVAGSEVLASAEVFDPASGRWAPAGPMARARVDHTLTTLPSGEVLVTGGAVAGGQLAADASAELFDPATGTWSAAGSSTEARRQHSATALDDGRVLLAGGRGGAAGDTPLASAELYDPAARTFTATAPMRSARADHVAAAVTGGQVLVAGGTGGRGGDTALASAEVFDPRDGGWTGVADLARARTGASVVVLTGGSVLVAGGDAVTGGARRTRADAERYDAARGRWASAGTMGCPRSQQAAVALGDGGALVVAGDATFPGRPPVAQSCVERYRP